MEDCRSSMLQYHAARGLDSFIRGYDFVRGHDFVRGQVFVSGYDLVRGHRLQLHLWTLVPIMMLEEAVSLDLLSDLVQLAFLGWIRSCSGGVLTSCASRVS